MLSRHEDVKFPLKVMINKHKTKVLFAEASSDFVDVLLSFLTLPLGTIVRVLEKHFKDEVPVIGSLNTLYHGLSNLGDVHFRSESCKQMLLNPRSSFSECCNLKLDISDTKPIEYFCCEDVECPERLKKRLHIGMYYGTTRCGCGRLLKKEIKCREFVEPGARVFTAKEASFILSDDMRMAPNVEGSILETLTNLGIVNTHGATLMEVSFGFNEIMKLLKGMFVSRSPLTDIVLGQTKTQSASATPRIEQAGYLLHKSEKVASSNSKKMILKATIQKSSNKLCFVQADDDFVDFLFSLPSIPLGGVEYLLGSSTCLANVDNLYRGLANINGEKHLKTKDAKARLLNPKLPHGYISINHILPLKQVPPPVQYWNPGNFNIDPYLSIAPMGFDVWEVGCCFVSSIKSPKCKGNCVKGSSMFMITDDLTVTPLCMSTTVSILNELEIPLSDIKEVELQIGLEEALNILKACLTSTSALTNSLLNPFLLKKIPKQEN